MSHRSACLPHRTVGLDVGDRCSTVCTLDAAGQVLQRATLPTEGAALAAHFGSQPPSRVILEATTHSPWISRLLRDSGHEVIVASPWAAARLSDPLRKTDRNDAEQLARTGRLDPLLLRPIRHRSEQQQHDRALLISRDQLVRTRAQLIGSVRGTVKASGGRIVGLTTEGFGRRAAPQIPEGLRPALLPTLEVLALLSHKIAELDRQIERVARERYPAVARLTQIRGIGTLTALAFVLTVQDPRRFRRRAVAAYLGLTPGKHQSGRSDPALSITKAGDGLVRRLLVQCAHYILGPFGGDCDLRRQGLALAARGGHRPKQRAAVAVARRLAVLLAALWRSGETYQPLRRPALA